MNGIIHPKPGGDGWTAGNWQAVEGLSAWIGIAVAVDDTSVLQYVLVGGKTWILCLGIRIEGKESKEGVCNKGTGGCATECEV
jgi:hypothetical protein